MKTSGIKKQGEAEILLESGTNELEVLVFGIGDSTFGVNVAKVREVILPVTVSAAPGQPSSVLGMFNLRNRLLPLVDLHHYLDIPSTREAGAAGRIIVTEFNGMQAAFQVDRVEQIYRMSWTHMREVPDSGGESPFAITGITEINERLVLMLDFESILDHITLTDEYRIDVVENALGVDRGGAHVLVAEDSNFIRGLMTRVLGASGYVHIEEFTSGLAAWKRLEQLAAEGQLPTVLVTDVEMPQMDGLALTRRIKQDPAMRTMPVVLFSSLITEDTRHKGQQVGADEQMAKPQLPALVGIVDKWVHQRLTGEPATPAAPVEAPPKAA